MVANTELDYYLKLASKETITTFLNIDQSYVYRGINAGKENYLKLNKLSVEKHNGEVIAVSKLSYSELIIDKKFIFGVIRRKIFHIYSELENKELSFNEIFKKTRISRYSSLSRFFVNVPIHEYRENLSKTVDSDIVEHDEALSEDLFLDINNIVDRHILLVKYENRIIKIDKNNLDDFAEEEVLKPNFKIHKIYSDNTYLYVILTSSQHEWSIEIYNRESIIKEHELKVTGYEIRRVFLKFDGERIYAFVSSHGYKLYIWDKKSFELKYDRYIDYDYLLGVNEGSYYLTKLGFIISKGDVVKNSIETTYDIENLQAKHHFMNGNYLYLFKYITDDPHSPSNVKLTHEVELLENGDYNVRRIEFYLPKIRTNFIIVYEDKIIRIE